MAKAWLHYTIMLTGVALAILILTSTKNTNQLNQLVFRGNSKLALNHQDQKMMLLRQVFVYLSLLIFIPTVLVMFIRIFTGKSSPATSADPLSIMLLNRIIANSIEQSFIFLGLYSYFLFDKSGDRFDNRQIILIASWFIISRIIFSVGYLIGGLVGFPTLRSCGITITMTVQFLLVEVCFSPKALTAPLWLGNQTWQV